MSFAYTNFPPKYLISHPNSQHMQQAVHTIRSVPVYTLVQSNSAANELIADRVGRLAGLVTTSGTRQDGAET